MTDEVSIKCKGGDIIDLSLTEFEDVLDSGRCPDCGEAIVTVVPDTFEVEMSFLARSSCSRPNCTL